MKKITVRKMMVMILIVALFMAWFINNVDILTKGKYRGIWIRLPGNKLVACMIDSSYIVETYCIIYWNDKNSCEIPFALIYDEETSFRIQHYRKSFQDND